MSLAFAPAKSNYGYGDGHKMTVVCCTHAELSLARAPDCEISENKPATHRTHGTHYQPTVKDSGFMMKPA